MCVQVKPEIRVSSLNPSPPCSKAGSLSEPGDYGFWRDWLARDPLIVSCLCLPCPVLGLWTCAHCAWLFFFYVGAGDEIQDLVIE